jgi:hypothetical protein
MTRKRQRTEVRISEIPSKTRELTRSQVTALGFLDLEAHEEQEELTEESEREEEVEIDENEATGASITTLLLPVKWMPQR